jgi:hypothetical protein
LRRERSWRKRKQENDRKEESKELLRNLVGEEAEEVSRRLW